VHCRGKDNRKNGRIVGTDDDRDRRRREVLGENHSKIRKTVDMHARIIANKQIFGIRTKDRGEGNQSMHTRNFARNLRKAGIKHMSSPPKMQKLWFRGHISRSKWGIGQLACQLAHYFREWFKLLCFQFGKKLES
jgi:hypothetical protein